MTTIESNQKILEFLLKKREYNKNLYFMPRMVNNKDRLSKGYYFLGNDEYVHISFWKGKDSKEKIHNIGFVVLVDGASYIEITCRENNEQKISQLKDLSKKLINNSLRFEQKNNSYKVRFYYSTKDYLTNLNHFIENEKKVIDEFLKKNNIEGISFLDDNFHSKYVLSRILNK